MLEVGVVLAGIAEVGGEFVYSLLEVGLLGFFEI